MKLQELLPFLAKNQNEFKVHCATPNGENNPLSIWLSGQDNFTKEQNIQTKQNFERKYILSFCEINKQGEWLFVGIYESFGVKETKINEEGKKLHIYDTKLKEDIGGEFIGKLVVGFDLKEESPSAARQRYRYLESLLDKMEVLELIVDCLTNPQIAEKLVITISTTKTHVHSILQKLYVNTRSKAISTAMKEGLV